MRRPRALARRAAMLTAGLAMLAGLASPPACAAGQGAHAIVIDPGVQRSVQAVRLPAVQLQQASDARFMPLSAALEDGGPIVVTFVYTGCTTLCPMTSRTLATVQERAGKARLALRIRSISLDPEQDTARRLRDYAAQFGAGPAWEHYTGEYPQILQVERAFGVDRGDKMNHAAAIFVRRAGARDWVRLDGTVTPADVMKELRS
jgi:protein SCO1/2